MSASRYSKKDYELVARILSANPRTHELVEAFADAFEQDNPTKRDAEGKVTRQGFDRKRFMKACEIKPSAKPLTESEVNALNQCGDISRQMADARAEFYSDIERLASGAKSNGAKRAIKGDE